MFNNTYIYIYIVIIITIITIIIVIIIIYIIYIIYIICIYIYVHATRKFHHISIISTIFSSENQIYMTQKGVCHAENPLYHHYITLYAIIFVPLHHIVGMYTMGV